MMKFSSLTNRVRKASSGFTMIELLIVIAILGILATAVLSAINPVEQINRGRDTGTRSDAEQLISAIDRHNAFKGFFPWMAGASDTDSTFDDGASNPALISTTGPNDHQATPCHFLNKLSTIDAVGDPCAAGQGTEELKITFVDRITDPDYRGLYIYNAGTTGSSTYVCFIPQSKAFRTDAETRCADDTGSGLPSDLSAVAGFLCSGYGDPALDVFSCLP
ncbi:prepilin-type N-terminal cleavage/methylation domain-containing protein [Candidatus Woesebacteria bacterium]|nr:prepilin-type N-terminal cleavage/methylation domain-containing protein [Candidatus Woesebacteria bacterium]